MNEVACKRFRPALRSGTGIGGRHIRSVLRIGIASAMVAFGSMACWDPGVEPAVPTTVTVSPSVVDLDAFDQSRKLSATVLDQNGQQIEDASVTWSAARPRVATVDGSGLVKAAGNGETTVTATAGTASGSASVKVEQVPRRVTVSPETVAFDAFDQSRQLSATALDANGHEIEGASVAWSTANPGVATVDGGGLVKAAGNGETTVTATAGTASGSASVEVEQVPRRVTVSPETVAFDAFDQSRQLSAAVLDANGHEIEGAGVAWSTANPDVATVDGDGLVKAAGNGETTVTATAGTASGSASVKVEQVPRRVTVSPETVAFDAFDQSRQLSAAVLDANGHEIEGAGVAWSTANPDVATVDGDGLVTAAGNGETTVTATAGTASGSASVEVEQVPRRVTVSPETVAFDAFDQSRQLSAAVLDANGHEIEGAGVAWSAANPGVATVDSDGLVTAAGNGETTVTATAGTASGSASVKVEQVPRRVTVSPETVAFDAFDQSRQLSAAVLDANGHEIEGAGVAWSAANPGVATVDSDGLVTAAGNGTTTVTAASGSASGSARVEVEQVPREVTVSPDSVEMQVGDSMRLTATALDANGHEIADAVFQWSSSVPATAWVSGAGVVGAMAFGTTTVTATAGAVSGSAYIVVWDDRGALAALYRATNGDDWTDNSGWMSSSPLHQWLGVSADERGRVTGIQLPGNNLTGRIPREIGMLTALDTLSLGGRWVSDTLRYNYLTGSIPRELGDLTKLVRLNLWGNQLTGSIPRVLAELPNLRVLWLGSNQLTGSIPPELGDLTELQGLSLSGNQLTGSIPPELGDLTELQGLYLSGNQLTGSIPPELGDLTALQGLDLYNNKLTGSIPPELGDLTELLGLYLYNNQLTGSIPPELGDLTELLGLSLSGNQLTGSIPPELGDLTALLGLYLNGNTALTGELPSTLTSLDAMEYFYFHATQLCAPTTSQFQQWLNGLNHWLGDWCGSASAGGAAGIGNMPRPIPKMEDAWQEALPDLSSSEIVRHVAPDMARGRPHRKRGQG